MSLLAAISKLRHSIAPRIHSDVEEEFRSTLDAYQADLIRHGLPEKEARRKARLDLGRPSAQNQTYRDAIGLSLFDELGGDIRYGLRALRRNPGFAAVAVLSLALGIGATTAMFSLIYAVLLHPFPYAGADRIVNPVLITGNIRTSISWFILSKAQLMNCALLPQSILRLASTTRTWRSPAADCPKTSRASTSRRMPGISLAYARFRP